MENNSISNVLESLDSFPTTRLRILGTIGLIIGTGVYYLLHACDVRNAVQQCVGWEPSSNWLIFLAALAGVDLTQYIAKGVQAGRGGSVVSSVNSPTVPRKIEKHTAKNQVEEEVETDSNAPIDGEEECSSDLLEFYDRTPRKLRGTNDRDSN